MIKFFLAAGLYLIIHFFITIWLSSKFFIFMFEPPNPAGLEGFAIIWFWLAGIICWIISGNIILYITARKHKKRTALEVSTFSLIALSWFSFFAYLAIIITIIFTASIIATYRSS